MKKIIFVTLIVAFSINAFAQKKNAIKINLLSFAALTGSGFYERSISDKTSLQMGLYYTGISVSDVSYSGFGLTPEFRIYPKGEGFKGFYVGPFLRYQNFSLEFPYIDENLVSQDGKASLSSFGGGVAIGGQFLLGGVVPLDLFVGPGYSAGNVSFDAGTEDDVTIAGFAGGLMFRVGLAVGFAF